MNILIVSATYQPSLNGVAVSTERMVKSLRSLGHLVYLVVPECKEKRIPKDPDAYYLTTVDNPLNKDYPLVIPRLSSGLKKWLSQKNIDIVHTMHPFVIGDFAKKIAGFCTDVKQEKNPKSKRIPLFLTYHTKYKEYSHFIPLIPNQVSETMVEANVRGFCKGCDAVITPTKFMKEYLEKDFSEHSISVPVVSNSTAGLESVITVKALQELRQGEKKEQQKLRAELSLPKQKKLLLSVSRHSKEKNLEPLIDMTSHLSQEYQLVLVGDGPHHDELIEYAKKSKQKVLFPGAMNQENVLKYMQAADLFVYSTRTDTLGISILEAMSTGLPVVAIDEINTRELISDGETGVLVTNFKDMSLVVSDLMKDQEKYAQLSKDALEEAQEHSIDSLSNGLIDLYMKYS